MGGVVAFDTLFATSVHSPRALRSFAFDSALVVSLLVDSWGCGAGLFQRQDFESPTGPAERSVTFNSNIDRSAATDQYIR